MGAERGAEGGASSEAAAALDFDAWAGLSARLLHQDVDERIDILDADGLTLEDWARCDEHHAMALAQDVAKGRMERAESYGRKCAAEMARRRREEAEKAPADAGATFHEASPAPAPPAEPAAPERAVAEDTSVPTFLQGAPGALELPTAGARPAIPRELAGTLMADSLPTFAKQAPAKPLPFGDVPSATFVASMDAPKPPASASAGSTIGLGVDLMSQMQAALPFAGKEASTAPLGEARPGTTAAIDPAILAKAATLPFPAAKPTGPKYARLPLQTYASLCTELALYPERAAETLTKYGVHDEEAHRALEQDWQARFAAHPDTREEWAQACKTYREWLLRQPKGA